MSKDADEMSRSPSADATASSGIWRDGPERRVEVI
jgi:hypothetical protein